MNLLTFPHRIFIEWTNTHKITIKNLKLLFTNKTNIKVERLQAYERALVHETDTVNMISAMFAWTPINVELFNLLSKAGRKCCLLSWLSRNNLKSQIEYNKNVNFYYLLNSLVKTHSNSSAISNRSLNHWKENGEPEWVTLINKNFGRFLFRTKVDLSEIVRHPTFLSYVSTFTSICPKFMCP